MFCHRPGDAPDGKKNKSGQEENEVFGDGCPVVYKVMRLLFEEIAKYDLGNKQGDNYNIEPERPDEYVLHVPDQCHEPAAAQDIQER